MTDALHRDDLLIELGCEELPPGALPELARAFFELTCAALDNEAIVFDAGDSRYHYSPRRMTLHLAAVAARQPDRHQERRGPSVAAAFDADGEPTAAAKGFAGSVGRPVAELDRLETDKGEWLSARVEIPGKPLSELLFPLLKEALARLPTPRPMRWSDHDFSFVRPVHWLVVLHGDTVLEGELFGCEAGRETRGHRVHAPGPHEIARPGEYLARLEDAFVLADHDRRREHILKQARECGARAGGVTRITDALLEEVNNLVEWPVAVLGRFDEEFLGVPQEALVASMESHQKFFPILRGGEDHAGREGEEGRLAPDFVIIANLESRDPEAMVAGYERVIRPRLADARFFWERDLARALPDRLALLDDIVFQKDLGSVGDKSRRIESVSRSIAEDVGYDPDLAARAGRLCKADLTTEMVGEFPELQGIMGAHYAEAANEAGEVATAIGSHYRPRFSGDAIPDDDAGRIVALADRLDTLVGIFAAGLKPSGNKDPYALRRSALGVLRILLDADIRLPLDRLLELSATALRERLPVTDDTLAQVKRFLLERLRHHALETGATARQLAGVLAAPLSTLPDFQARLDAVRHFMQQPEAESLVAANKRIGNILKKQENDISEKIDENVFTMDEESALFSEITIVQEGLEELLRTGDYDTALSRLARLREPVDRYFDKVMVMDEDPTLRANRLATLKRLKSMFDRIADFSVTD